MFEIYPPPLTGIALDNTIRKSLYKNKWHRKCVFYTRIERIVLPSALAWIKKLFASREKLIK